MTVFRGFLTLVRRSAPISLLYIAIFLAISIAAQMLTGQERADAFQPASLAVGIVDEDNTTLSAGLGEYLGKFHTVTRLPNEKDVLQERLFYRDVAYILTIPRGFGGGEADVNVTKIPGTIAAFYVDGQINAYLNGFNALRAGGYTDDEAARMMLNTAAIEPKVDLLVAANKRPAWAGYAYMFQYMPYVIIAIIAYTLGTIMIDFYRPNARRRMRCAPISALRMNGEFLLGYGIYGLVIWALFTAMPFVMYGGQLLGDANLPFYLLNNLLLVLTALALTSLVGMLTRSLDVLSGVVNVISLGMSFLCGVFIPLELLDKNVGIFSQFLPVYWYERANTALAENTVLGGASLRTVLEGFGIQLLFAAALVGAALIVAKLREQETA
ncbi:MAG: ABC transporter permease [Oscillospiraceae bacterium]|jgi:ABC-2 type transport system permease protein|nr:ABC transporter permease [Oscillospiraceae bacterium]